MKKLISILIFTTAIGCGVGVGYGATHVLTFTYKNVTAYASGLKIDLQTRRAVAERALGGPEAEPLTDSEISTTTPNQTTIEQYFRSLVVDPSAKTPPVIALSYLVADLKTGTVLLSKNTNLQIPIASVTKLMTAVVSDETLGLDTQTTVTSGAINTYGTQGELKTGEKYSVLNLFYPLLLESSNDAAEALASTKNRDKFISDMNTKAQSLGMLHTSYEDASGLSPNNTSTVTDLFKLAQYISNYRKYIFEITAEKEKDLGKKTWFSNSRFRSDHEYVGGKNGYTDEALKTQVVLFDEDFNGEKRTIAYIVLRSTDVAADIKNLRNFVHQNVEYK
jgi:D-alanyl-D-alanine carboxypeptidase